MGKRLFDIGLTLLGAPVLIPALLFTALLVYAKLGRPVLFRQTRPGLGGVPFDLIKFRSMGNTKDDTGSLLSDDARMSGFGRKLRASSLDELPEFLNVLRGEMSLVGPRPLLMQYLPLYSQDQARRHDVRPGITGWAQIKGRNALSWDEKFALDVWYVDNRTMWLDVKILVLTLGAVFKGEGVAAENHVTMPAFTGSDEEVRK